MASRALRVLRALGTVLAYVVAGIPALIGIGFVARYAFVTSDTQADGAATAFLFGMVAAGAFAGPAVAVAVGNRGRRIAALVWWALAALAITANWTHTLSAIAHRGAGLDANSAKITTDTATDRATLARLERDLGSLPPFIPTTPEAVTAARAAAELAQRNRIAECGPINETRGSRCREREADERAKQDALTTALENKAATDRAAQLEASAAALRKRLADAPPTPPENLLGRTLGRLLPVSAAMAATLQQAYVSAIVELLIAAVLALPELLRHPPAQRRLNATRKAAIGVASGVLDEIAPSATLSAPLLRQTETLPALSATAEVVGSRRGKARRDTRRDTSGRQLEVVPAASNIAPDEIDPKPVVDFLAKHMPPARGDRADWADLYGDFLPWDAERGGKPLSASQFGAVLRHICEQADIRVERHGDRVYCLDRRLERPPDRSVTLVYGVSSSGGSQGLCAKQR
jgi:hypothetical protein